MQYMDTLPEPYAYAVVHLRLTAAAVLISTMDNSLIGNNIAINASRSEKVKYVK